MTPSKQDPRHVATSHEYDPSTRSASDFDGQSSPKEQVDVAIDAGTIAAIGSLDAVAVRIADAA